MTVTSPFFHSQVRAHEIFHLRLAALAGNDLLLEELGAVLADLRHPFELYGADPAREDADICHRAAHEQLLIALITAEHAEMTSLVAEHLDTLPQPAIRAEHTVRNHWWS